MTLTLLTGATGLVGNNIARRLVEGGRRVRALVRSPDRAAGVVPPECDLVQGDVTDAASVAGAMEGCSVVYHASGIPEQWLKDPDSFQRVNVEGTRHMIEAAVHAGVEKFLYTSTIDIFAAASGDEYDESRIDPEPKGTDYERSKQDADRLVVDALDRGLPAVFLHPSGLYGPGPPASPGLNSFFVDLVRGKMPMLLPGGIPCVYSLDVADGHLLAEERAAVGSRYILSESYFELPDLARAVAEAAGLPKNPPVLPLWIAKALAAAGEGVSALTGKPPLLPKGQLHFLQWRARPDARRARQELGWRPVPFRDGLRLTLDFLRETGRI